LSVPGTLSFLVAFIVSAGCGDDGGAADTAPPVDSSVDDTGLGDADASDGSDTGISDASDTAVPDAAPPWTGPDLLSETGLYSDFDARTLAEGVTIFAPRWPLYSDGSEKNRYLLLPPGTTIDTSDADAWVFPDGTRAWKDFRRDGVLVETRFLEKTGEGDFGWRYVAYVWDVGETEAVATPEGLVDALGTPHDVPDQADCLNCHRGGSGFLLGVSALQLGDVGGLLETLVGDGWLSDAPPPAADLEAPGTPEIADVLGYLHANCGHCHNDRHPLSFMRSMRLNLPIGVATPEETPTYRTAIGTPADHEIEGTFINVDPGMPARSQLWVRMGLLDPDLRMPQVGTELPDAIGVPMIEAWILGLPTP